MIDPYIHSALARERQNTLLEQARAIHRAREARSHGTRTGHGSWFRWMPARLASAWTRPLTSRPQSSSEAAS